MAQFVSDIQTKAYPGPENSFKVNRQALADLRAYVAEKEAE